MGGLFSSLHTASAALNAFSQALGAEQTNVANASTPGYAVRKVAVQPIGAGGTGGTDAVVLTSSGNAQADALVRQASSQAAASSERATQLSSVNQLFDITGSSGILAALQGFSTAFSQASVSPGDGTLRATALSAADDVATAFRRAANSLADQRAQADTGIRNTVSQINDLASQIRQINGRIGGSTALDPAIESTLRSDLDQLSSLVDITVTPNGDGTVNVLAGGQLPLVIGDQGYTLSVDPTAAAGAQVTSSGGGHSPDVFSGTLGSLLDFRNNTLGGLLGSGTDPGSLNTLAKGFASRVNALLATGGGAPVFTFGSNDFNVARSLSLSAGFTADQLALGTAGASNGIANQLAGLATSGEAADQIGGLSVQDFFSSIAANAGQKLANAQTDASASQSALTAATVNRQQLSGVSLDEEAISITAYQRAYQANARVVSILNDLTGEEVNLLK